MKTTVEAAKKEIEVKEILKLPYDSGAIFSKFVTDTLELKFYAQLHTDSRGNMSYKFTNKMKENTSFGHTTNILDMCNDFAKDFYLSKNWRNKSKYNETFKINAKINNILTSHASDDCQGNVQFWDMIKSYVSRLEQIPTSFTLDLQVIRDTNVDYRDDWWSSEADGETPESVMNKLFVPTINLDRAKSNDRRSYYYTPFSDGSIKNKIYCMDKENMVFAIEYLYGKKLAISTPIHKVAKVMVGLPNNRFNINDIRVGLQLRDNVLSCSKLQAMYDALQEIGIKPATNLSRWCKLRDLKLTEKN